MKWSFLTSAFCLWALQGLSQTNLPRPDIGQVQEVSSLAPGTIRIEVMPLSTDWKDTTCRQDVKRMGIKVMQVLGAGSGLVNPLHAGDSLQVHLLNGTDFDPASLEEKDTLWLKEQLCTFEKTYYTLIRKE